MPRTFSVAGTRSKTAELKAKIDETGSMGIVGRHGQANYVFQDWFVHWLKDIGIALQNLFARDTSVRSLWLRILAAQELGVVLHDPTTYLLHPPFWTKWALLLRRDGLWKVSHNAVA